MHLSDDELKTLWQEETKPAARTACLSSELLVRAGEGTLAANEMAQVVSHIEQCADCAEEYRLVAAVKDWSTEAAATHPAAFPTQSTATVKKERWWQKFSLQNWQIPAFALAGLALLFMAWFVWRAVSKKELQREIVNFLQPQRPPSRQHPLRRRAPHRKRRSLRNCRTGHDS